LNSRGKKERVMGLKRPTVINLGEDADKGRHLVKTRKEKDGKNGKGRARGHQMLLIDLVKKSQRKKKKNSERGGGRIATLSGGVLYLQAASIKRAKKV